MADPAIYDEVVRFSSVDNISCYVDKSAEAGLTKIVTKVNPGGVDQYTFDSTSRVLDETPFYAAGNMRGLTITFAPDKGSNGSTIDLKQGVVNQYIQTSGNHRFGAMQNLYARVRSTVGDKLLNTSTTYRNSEFTVFLVVGSTGGNDASAQDAIRVYGQWSGTNLPAEVSYKIVSDRVTGDDGKQIVEINDNKWNTENGNKITVNPGDLNGGGSFSGSTQTGNQTDPDVTPTPSPEPDPTPDPEPDPEGPSTPSGDILKEEDLPADGKTTYIYLVGSTMVFRNTPLATYDEDWGTLEQWNTRYITHPWYQDTRVTRVEVQTPVLVLKGDNLFDCPNLAEVVNPQNLCMSRVTSMYGMFSRTKITELDARSWDTSNVTDMYGVFMECENLKTLKCETWDVGKVTRIWNMFTRCSELENLDVSSWRPVNLESMLSAFNSCGKLKTLDVENWGVTKIKDMKNAFAYCESITSFDLSKWDVSNLTTLEGTFYGNSALEEIKFGTWNTKNVTSLEDTFRDCKSLKTIDMTNWNMSNVKIADYTFYYCRALENINATNWNMSKVESMNSMFSNSNIKEIDISAWNPVECSSMREIFYSTTNLKTVYADNLNIPKVTTVQNMFRNAQNLETVHAKNWNSGSLQYVSGMFDICPKVKNVDLSNWTTGQLLSMDRMFSGCYALENLKMSGCDASKVTTANRMFMYCNNLKTFDMSIFGAGSLKDTEYMFEECSSLETIDISNLNVQSMEKMSRMFMNCRALSSIGDIDRINGWNVSGINTSYMFLNTGLSEYPTWYV